jgi:hypothetical protein
LEEGSVVFALLIVSVVVAVPVLYAADRIIKARAQSRRLHMMSERLTAATVRAEEQHERQQEAARAGTELTSVMPAISRPPLSLPDKPMPGEHAHGEHTNGAARPRTGRGREEHNHAHPRRSSRTGEHEIRRADQGTPR